MLKTEKCLVISYFPYITNFMRDNARIQTLSDDMCNNIQKFIDNNRADVKAIAWVKDDEGIIPTFLIDDGENIFNDITTWSENKPSEWFTIEVLSDGDEYCMAIFPNIDKTAKRMIDTANALGKTIEPSAVVFKPIECASTRSEFSNIWLSKNADFSTIGIISSLNTENIYYLYNLPVRYNNTSLQKYIDDYKECKNAR